MKKEQALINHIQEYIDSGMWEYEACYLDKTDLKVIINALKKYSILDQIRAEIYQKQYDFMSDGDYKEGIRLGLMLAYQIIDKYRAESEVQYE